MQYRFDDFVVDTEQFLLSQQGQSLHAEPQVIELILHLLANHGRVVSQDELNREIWHGRVVSDSALSTRIKLARQALGDDGRQQKYIRTVHKKGFVFNAGVDVTRDAGHEPVETPARPPADAALRPSLAITRFVDQSSTSRNSTIAEGITDDIITTLSKVSKLEVLNFQTAAGDLDGVTDNPRQLEIPRIDYRLEGSLLCEGERLRISVRLVEVSSGRYAWAQRYDRRFHSLFELQDDISREVVSALQVELTDGDQALLALRGTDNIEAWKLTFEGQAAVLEHRQERVRHGRRLLETAVALDENYALAWSALATAHWKESLNDSWSDSREASLQHAIEASERALRIDARHANTLAVRGLILISQRRFDEALDSARQAIVHARSEAHTLALASLGLRSCGEAEASILQMQKAMRLCPLYPAWYPYSNALCYWMMRQYGPALTCIEEAIRIDAGLSLNFMVLAMIRAETGEQHAAKTAIARLLEIDPDFRIGAFTAGVPFREEAIEERRLRALRDAGLPE